MEIRFTKTTPSHSKADASTSRILALPKISSWLASHGYSPSDLRPYLTLYPSQGNPYDFAQGAITNTNGTNFLIYQYLVTNSANNLVIGGWVAANSSQTVAKVFTYENVSLIEGTSINTPQWTGQEVYSSLSGGLQGAGYESQVANDLENPITGCTSSYCWAWDNWLGVSNYLINGSVPQSPYFFQVELLYWGGNVPEPTTTCGGTFSHNCVVFQDLDGSQTYGTYSPGYGGWTGGTSITFMWSYFPANCLYGPPSPNNVVTENVTYGSTTVSDTFCMPYPVRYSQFFEERPTITISGVPGYALDPEFSSSCQCHSFTGYLVDVNGDHSLSDATDRWNLQMYDGSYLLVSASANNNQGTYSTWTDNWQSSL